MTVSMYNPLTYSQHLKSAGFTEKQAETLANEQSFIIANYLEKELATKKDIQEINKNLITVMNKIETMEMRIIIRLGAWFTVGLAILGFILKK